MGHAIAVATPARGLGPIACANHATRGGRACQQLIQRLVAMVPPD